jgi:NADH-quinone oxidoreductase subunit L
VFGQRLLHDGYRVFASVTPIICLLLFAGACGKSAQFPLHVWLPDAMEGPTPVSALIHAATMVTAGVYLVARCAPLFLAGDLNAAHYVVATIGAFTALMAAVIALTQTDLKRILAYSTISQLGFMFLGLGTMTVAGIIAGMFHLFTHAFFKALLFLGAGSVMHAMGGVIDIRQFSGLRKKLPVTHFTFLIGCLALAGFPLLAGFWSKDAILAAVYDKARAVGADPADSYVYWPLLAAAVVTSVLTAFYTFRAFFRTFYGHEQVPPEAGHHAHESPGVMTVPLTILAAFAAGAGVFMLVYPGFVERTPSLEFVARRSAAAESGHFHWNVAALSTAAALAGIGTAWLL